MVVPMVVVDMEITMGKGGRVVGARVKAIASNLAMVLVNYLVLVDVVTDVKAIVRAIVCVAA